MILVSVLILVVCQAFSNIIHVSISECQLPASECCYLVQKSNIARKTAQIITHVYQRKKEKHQDTSEKNPMCSYDFNTVLY